MLMAHESRRHGVAGRRGEAVSRKWQTWARDGGGGSGRLCGSSRLGLSSFHRHPESDQAERDGVAHFPCLMGVAPSPPASWEHSSTALGTAHPGRAPAERVAGWQAGGGRSTAWTSDLRIPRGHAAAWQHPPHRQREPGGSAGPGQGAGCGASAAGSGHGRVAVRGADRPRSGRCPRAAVLGVERRRGRACPSRPEPTSWQKGRGCGTPGQGPLTQPRRGPGVVRGSEVRSTKLGVDR